MDAFKCDGCKEFQAGEPLFTITLAVTEFGGCNEWHCCAWSCVEMLVKHEREKVSRPSGLTPGGSCRE